MCDYIRVAEDEQMPEEEIELPSDEDGTILLSTVQAQFPGSIGLRFRNEETQSWRGVRLANGILYPPVNGWGNALYIAVTVKTDSADADSSSKRKYEESPTGREPHSKIMKNYSMETDQDLLSDMIVLGLSWKAKDEDLFEYFSRFGELDFYEVKRNQQTGQSRGFAFIRFKDANVARTVLARTHTILGRRVDIRSPKGKDDAPRKIFIGRLPSNCTASDVHSYFEKYGTLVDVYIPQPFRQFGFVTFASSEAARNVLARVHVLNGARINCTPAEPKAQSKGHAKNAHESPSHTREMPGIWGGNILPYMNTPDRGGTSAFANQMNAMWNMAALAQGMAAGMVGEEITNLVSF
ncbi:TAR DNA-binding protein 43-like isoform X3 [Xenia sp. Carnegie-2017]|uniref:TAR DNA-binding protein 43-like isoform X3 n=1 Tax=Xenia sp. Carnegie-2017 TaxID=2897299 RepID=UPI001F03477C|nr:TAR DNA-binding protein 43-like isoform X3 [Xenia sp. Carnegie-2017]